MKIYFLHGKNKTPDDKKLVDLSSVAIKKGFEVEFIDNTDTKNPNIRAKTLVKKLKSSSKDSILVGGSMGGYASVWASSCLHVKGIFLLAPALYLDGYNEFKLPLKCKNIMTIHGLDDKIVPLENSINFAKQTNSSLHAINDDHSLNNSSQTIMTIFETFLENLV